MKGMKTSLLPILLLLVACAATAGAQPESWAHPDGTIHYYNAVAVPGGINWNAAFDSALTPGGYLATITSSSENAFVFGLVDSQRYWYPRPSGRIAGPWLGGFRSSGAPVPESGWTWVNWEPFTYRNWTSGEPDNLNENELNFGEASGLRVPTWNDIDGSDDSIRGFVLELSADSTSVGLFRNDSGSFNGYTLFAPNRSQVTYLIDNKGRLVHSWTSSYTPGQSVYFLEDGSLLRTAHVGNPDFPSGPAGGRVERFDWNGNLTWSYNYSSTTVCQHHDIEPLPNGHVLLVAWELKSRAEAIAAGRDPTKLTDNKLWPDHIVEVNPANDSIVWEWHVWDHLIQDYDSTRLNYGVVANHSELVDLNYIRTGNGGADWNHVNAVDYNPLLDQIIISAHDQNEIWVVDHSTTTAEARGHTGGRQGMGGDILYRWGNPLAYRAGTNSDRKLYGQHDSRWIEPGLPGAGHMMVFNNGNGRPGGNYSTVDEFIPPCDSLGHYTRPAPGSPFGPAAQCWIYTANPPASFYSSAISGAHRLPNGNTLICEGNDGRFFEVAPDTHVVWLYINPVIETGPLNQGDTMPNEVQGKRNNTFRATRFASDYPGLVGRDLTPGYPIERYASPPVGIANRLPPASCRLPRGLSVIPSPARGPVTTRYRVPLGERVQLRVYNMLGEEIRTLANGYQPSGTHDVVWDGLTNRGHRAGPGVYVCRLSSASDRETEKILFTR
jgi:hypothetical protein